MPLEKSPARESYCGYVSRDDGARRNMRTHTRVIALPVYNIFAWHSIKPDYGYPKRKTKSPLTLLDFLSSLRTRRYDGGEARGGIEMERGGARWYSRFRPLPRFRQNRDIYQDPPDKINRHEQE